MKQKTSISYTIYECDNPACELRFPAPTNGPRGERCPRCKHALRRIITYTLEQEAVQVARVGEGGRLEALLDNLRSGWNVGSIFRTADCLGVSRLHLCGITPEPSHPQVYRTALGAEKTVPFSYSGNSVKKTRQLCQEGYRIWGLEDVPGADNLFELRAEEIDARPIVLILGNEISGIDLEVLGMCERVLAIPMLGTKRSLNVAVAFGIAVSVLRQRLVATQENT